MNGDLHRKGTTNLLPENQRKLEHMRRSRPLFATRKLLLYQNYNITIMIKILPHLSQYMLVDALIQNNTELSTKIYYTIYTQKKLHD